MAIIFPYDEPIYVGTTGVDGVDDLLADNPWPFNAVADGAGGRPDASVGIGTEYPVAFLNGTNRPQPDPDGWSPVFFICYANTFRVEVHGAFTGVEPGQAVFQIPSIIAPRLVRVPLHGTAVDFASGWRGYIDLDGTVYYMAEF